MTSMPTMTHHTTAQTEDAAIQLEHDFVEIIRQRIGLNETLATIHAQEIVRGLRERHGGQELWIPAPDKSERNAAILRDFNGVNAKDVMQRHGISRAHLYRIVGGGRPRGKGVNQGAPSIGVSSPAAP
ncbi:Mor transcription activator family protein [Acidovorax delafieldii]|uniref:Mor transcription activator family protein n=1 Tax=Acidovorax delafieldii TaxID=47920 RepID=UPI003ECEC3F2